MCGNTANAGTTRRRYNEKLYRMVVKLALKNVGTVYESFSGDKLKMKPGGETSSEQEKV